VTEPSPAAPQAVPQTPIAPQAAPAASPAPSTSSASPAARNTIADVAYDRLSPDKQSQYARIKDADNNPEWVRRDELATDRTTKPDGTTTEAPPPADPNARHKFGDMEFSEQELRDLLTAKADAELKKANLPATPADYVPALPENFKLPTGVDFKVDAADPMLADARAWAHSKGLSQSDFSELISIYATGKGHEQALLNTATAAEVAKMGANGVQRVTALETWLRGIVGDKLAGPMRQMMVTADIAKGFETLQQRFVSQGVASFSQAHREPGNTPGRASDAEYAAMTSAQRLDYARGFDQRQFGGVNPNGYSSDQP
jgi:hypothetical protein